MKQKKVHGAPRGGERGEGGPSTICEREPRHWCVTCFILIHSAKLINARFRLTLKWRRLCEISSENPIQLPKNSTESHFLSQKGDLRLEIGMYQTHGITFLYKLTICCFEVNSYFLSKSANWKNVNEFLQVHNKNETPVLGSSYLFWVTKIKRGSTSS